MQALNAFLQDHAFLLILEGLVSSLEEKSLLLTLCILSLPVFCKLKIRRGGIAGPEAEGPSIAAPRSNGLTGILAGRSGLTGVSGVSGIGLVGGVVYPTVGLVLIFQSFVTPNILSIYRIK